MKVTRGRIENRPGLQGIQGIGVCTAIVRGFLQDKNAVIAEAPQTQSDLKENNKDNIMALELDNPSPLPPVMEHDFSVEASGGSPDYTFKWRTSDGEMEEVVQTSSTLKVAIPDGTAGQMLFVTVVDGNEDSAGDSWLIVSSP